MIAFEKSLLTSAMDLKHAAELSATKEIRNSSSETTKKQQPSPSSFLSNLKDFNIENAKYRHYGHSMSSQQLHKIVNPDATGQEFDRCRENSRSSDGSSYHLTSPLASPPEHISRALELPANKLYSEAIISQMLLLRTEQEKTKQASEKVELGRVVTQLLKEAKDHGIGNSLIHRLFLDEDSEEYKTHIMKLRSQSACGKLYVSEKGEKPLNDTIKQKTPIHTPSPNKSMENGNETLASLSSSSSSSSSKLVASTPTSKNANTSHIMTTTDSGRMEQDINNGIQQKTETWGHRVDTIPVRHPSMTGQQRSPTIPFATQPIYPVYYQVHENFPQQRKQTHTNDSNGTEDSVSPQLGHKHQKVITQPPIHFPHTNGVRLQNPEPQSAGHFVPGYAQQGQEQHMFYMNPQPPGTFQGPPIIPPQFYALPPIAAPGPVPWVAPPVVHEKDWENEEAHAHKKPRGPKNGISFMINTPKNPPARKYKKRTESS